MNCVPLRPDKDAPIFLAINLIKKVGRMKNNKLIICSIFIIFILAVTAAETKVAAQKEGEIVGGYGEISVESKEARSAAAFAVRTRAARTHKKITLVKILKAEQQVVAGLNYRICMDVHEGRRKPRTVTAVVYQNLKNKRSLSRWKNGACSDL